MLKVFFVLFFLGGASLAQSQSLELYEDLLKDFQRLTKSESESFEFQGVTGQRLVRDFYGNRLLLVRYSSDNTVTSVGEATLILRNDSSFTEDSLGNLRLSVLQEYLVHHRGRYCELAEEKNCYKCGIMRYGEPLGNWETICPDTQPEVEQVKFRENKNDRKIETETGIFE